MNQNEYLKEMENNSNFCNKIQSLPLTSVKISQTLGQARQTGHIQSHVSDLQFDIYNQGQQVPITVERDGKGFIAIDGNHRVEALRELNKMYPESAKYLTVRAIIKKFSTDADRMKYQALANEHLPAKKNSPGDIAYHIRRLQGARDPSVPMPPTLTSKHRKYAKDLKAYINDVYSVASREVARIVNDLCSTLKNQKLQNISKNELEDMFIKFNTLGWSGRDDNKEGIEGWKMYTSARAGGKLPNKSVVSYCFGAKTLAQQGKVQNAVVVWDNNPLGKDEKSLDKYRAEVVESWNKANSSNLLKRGTTLVDKIFIAPQKLSQHCEEEGFYEVQKKNNKFIVKSIPKNGWQV